MTKTEREKDLLLVETVAPNVNFFDADVVADEMAMMLLLMMIRITILSSESNMVEKSSREDGVVG